MAKRSKPTAGAAPGSAEAIGIPPPALGEAEDFPIVGIGASAGGLEALEQFLSHVPADSGMAFIVIQHLDPTRKGIMPELLQRVTDMKVMQADNQMKVAPHCVYVIPPNKDMSILHGSLHLLDPVAARGLRLPIDFFFRALADDRQERAVCAVLSGMGSDGTLGLKAVKEKGGLVLVQEPASAKFGGMPRSAIDTGLADIVAPAETLPARLVAAYRHPLPAQAHDRLPEGPTESALDKITLLLRARTGRDFSPYKKSTIVRRIERRMGIHQIDKIAVYVRYLQENPGEVDLLFKELLIGVTSFFRDPSAWDYLREHALPQRLAQLPNGCTVRAWVPACATGEDAYSLAIVLREVQQQAAPTNRFDLQVFATDLDQDAIDRARQGFYPANIAADVTPERLERYFVTEEGGYRVSKEIREKVIFAHQDILSDPPFTKLDVLSCRNLLIYLSAMAQTKLLPLFHCSLNPGGILFLGSAETIGSFTDLFAPLDCKTRLYRRIGTSAAMAAAALHAHPLVDRQRPFEADAVRSAEGSLQALADRLILQRFAPAAVLVNSQGDILYISGRTGNYLEPAAGKANWNIHAMAREGLRHELGMALSKALHPRGTIEADGFSVAVNGSRQSVKLSVHAIDEPMELHGMALIAFQDVAVAPPPPAADVTRHAPARGARAAQWEAELNRARQENLTLREDMQSSGGTALRQRGTPVHQRRASVHQRGADDLQGRTAVAQ